jgi:opine dehydrogenase
MKISVLGAGNGGCAAAADLSKRGFSVNLYSQRKETLQPILDVGGIKLIENSSEEFISIDTVTQDIEEALKDTQIVLVTVPAVAHSYYIEVCAPHLREGQIIVLNPGSTGGALHFLHGLRQLRAGYVPPICETNTLTYVCRLVGEAAVRVTLHQKNLLFSTIPATETERCADIFRIIFPNVLSVENALVTSLSNFNAIMHPAGTIMNIGWVEFAKGDFAYYYEGNTPAVCRIIEAVDRERLNIFKKLGYSTSPFLEFFYRAGLTTKKGFESGSIYVALQNSEPNRFIKAPQSLDHRYVHEDIGYGLLPMMEIAGLLNLDTPVMQALVTLASRAVGIDYSNEGLNLEKMGIAGFNKERLLTYLQEGE